MAFALLLGGGPASPAAAGSAGEILETAKARYGERVASVESVTIVQEALGMESTVELRKTRIDDEILFGPAGVARSSHLGSMYPYFDRMAEHATVQGTESVGGKPCWVLHVTDCLGIPVSTEGSGDFRALDGTLWLDQQEYVVRRFTLNGEGRREGVFRPLSMEMDLGDYREIDGWLHPFRTEMRLDGPGGAETQDMAALREGMRQLNEELAKMPPEQRQMMEQMMAGQLPALDTAVQDGALTVVVEVKEVRVDEPAN